MRYYLNIGTNLGNRRDNLQRAIAALRARCGECVVSQVVESQPWGFNSAHAFLNVGVAVDSEMQPLEMLSWLQGVERTLGSGAHRDAQGNYIDRLVDIDIMEIANEQGHQVVINTPELTVPHQHLSERDFFLIPLRELKKNVTFVN